MKLRCDHCEQRITAEQASRGESIYPDSGTTACPSCAQALLHYAECQASKWAEEDANQPEPIPGWGR